MRRGASGRRGRKRAATWLAPSLFALLLAIAGPASRPLGSDIPTATDLPAEVAAEAVARRHVFLWQVSRPGTLGSTLYLLGSTHAARAPQRDLDPAIEGAFAAATVLAVEVDTRRTPPSEIARTADALGRIADGGALASRLPAPVYEAARAALRERGLRADALDAYEPWFASLLLSGQALLRLGYHPSFGVEEYLLERAQNKRVVELEGAGAQLEVLDRLSRELQAAMLERTVESLGGLDGRIAALGTAWREGDAAALESLVLAGSSGPPSARALDEFVYYARNRAMAEKLEQALAREGGTWFAAIGAAHLVGPRGIPALFAARGYRVEQVSAIAAPAPAAPAQSETPFGIAVLR